MTNWRKKYTLKITIVAMMTLFAAIFSCDGGGTGYSGGIPQRFFGPTAMVVTPDVKDLRGVFLYVLNSQGDTLTVMDTKFRTYLKHHSFDKERQDIVFLGMSPHDLVITEDGNWLYITDAADGIVRKVEAHPPYSVKKTRITARAGRMVLPYEQSDERSAIAYITCPDTLELLSMEIGPESDAEIDRIDLPGTPTAITASPDGSFLAISTEEGDVLFVETASFEVKDELTVTLGGRLGNLITDATADFLFVINNDPPQINVVDLNTYTETEDEITFDNPLANMARSLDGKYLYFSSQAGTMFVFSMKHRRACGASFEQVFFKDLWPQSNPKMVDVEVFDCQTRDEFWYVEYQADTDDWKVTGSKSLTQSVRARTNQYYLSDNGMVGFRILPGTRNPSDGDLFYFETKGGWEPVRIGLVPDGVAVAPYWKYPRYDLIFIANTGTHNVSIIYGNEFVSLGSVN